MESNSVYTADFLPNDTSATGQMEPIEADEEGMITLPKCGYKLKGYAFTHWSTSPFATKDDPLLPGDKVHLTESDKFYARWERRVSLKFDPSGAEGGEAPKKVGVTERGATLPECSFTREGCRFAGWVLGDRLMQAGDTVFLADLPKDCTSYTATAAWDIERPAEECLDVRTVETNVSLGKGEGNPARIIIFTNTSGTMVDVDVEVAEGSVDGFFFKTYQDAVAPGESCWFLDVCDDKGSPHTLRIKPSASTESIISATSVEETERTSDSVAFRVTNISAKTVRLDGTQWLLLSPGWERPGYHNTFDIDAPEESKGLGGYDLAPGKGATVRFAVDAGDRELWYCPSGSVIM